MDTILNFLRDLKQNNERDWFQNNKKRYEKAKKEFEDILNRIIPEIYKFDPSIGLIAAKDCVFRIYRDIRFSTDKTPYKTHFGGYIAKGGRKSLHAGYYVHVDAEQSFLAGGMHMPPGDVLKKIRMEIMYNVDEFKSIITNKKFRDVFGTLDGEKLTRPPKDFPADFPEIDLLKYKSYIVVNQMDIDKFTAKDFEKYAVNVFRTLHPFNKFLSRAMD